MHKYIKNGAGSGAQTRDLCLGKAALYQLSYSRVFIGGQRGNRTPDTGIFSPLLYRLSYLTDIIWRPGWGSDPRPLA